MLARVFRYSYAQAKTRALQGLMLSSEDWHFLLQMKNLGDVVEYLGGTDYAKALAGMAATPEPEPEILTRTLYRTLFSDYAALARSVPSHAARLLTALAARYEAEDLKTLLRGIHSGASAAAIRSLLYHPVPFSRLPIADLLEARQLNAAIDLLAATPYHRPLTHALPQCIAQDRLFPLEIAVDRTVLDQLDAAASSLKGPDRRGANRLTGCLFDCLNLTWLVRLRHYYNLSPEEAINYTGPRGRSLSLQQLGRLARCQDLGDFLAALESPYRDVLEQSGSWQQVELLLHRYLSGQLVSNMRGDPFQVRLQVAWLLFKEDEIKSLRSLFSAIQLGTPGARLLTFMTLPQRGSSRV